MDKGEAVSTLGIFGFLLIPILTQSYAISYIVYAIVFAFIGIVFILGINAYLDWRKIKQEEVA